MTPQTVIRPFVLTLTVLAPAAVTAQEATPAQTAAPAQSPAYDPERRVNLAEPDFGVITLPTTLRVPRFRSAFRMTHRFGRPLGAGGFGDLAADLFGLDSGGIIGLEYRFGIVKGGQIGVHRTNNRTINLFGQYDILRRATRGPFNAHVTVSVEGTDNFRDRYTPSVGAVVSWQAQDRAAFYLAPTWVHNANLFPSASMSLDVDTVMLGLGGRVRVRPTVYLVGEFLPRIAGYSPNTHQGSFGIEKRAGGHTFQLNFSNGFGTTPGQIARGGTGSQDWYIGFNLTRKFF
ncbi:MAG: DUF5777 family beta-barrel protein [Vicinamibacterales bacterium]